MITDARESMRPRWSQAELARRLHVSRPTVSRWESEEYEPDKETIIRLVRLLPISGDVFLERLGYPVTPTAESRLPRDIVDALLDLTPDQLAGLRRLIGAPTSSGLAARSQGLYRVAESDAL